jgi:hypothetical protein
VTKTELCTLPIRTEGSTSIGCPLVSAKTIRRRVAHFTVLPLELRTFVIKGALPACDSAFSSTAMGLLFSMIALASFLALSACVASVADVAIKLAVLISGSFTHGELGTSAGLRGLIWPVRSTLAIEAERMTLEIILE